MSLSRGIDELGFTLKLARDSRMERKSELSTRGMNTQTNWLMSYDVINAHKLYIYEFGCNI